MSQALIDLYIFTLQHRQVADWMATREAIGKELIGHTR